MSLFPIGVFSRMTNIPVSTLRYYHEIGLLEPSSINEDTNYRMYGELELSRARAIVVLRELGCGLKEIQEAMKTCSEEVELVELLRKQQKKVALELKQLKGRAKHIDTLLHHIEHFSKHHSRDTEVECTEIPDLLFGGHLHEGSWQDCGKILGTVARKAGRSIAGPAMSLCHDEAYEDPAHYEAGFILKRPVKGLNCRPLKGGRVVRAVHVGPYSTLSFTYEQMLKKVLEEGYELQRPTREIYLKGPGFIFSGNPEKYRTEIIFCI